MSASVMAYLALLMTLDLDETGPLAACLSYSLTAEQVSSLLVLLSSILGPFPIKSSQQKARYFLG